LRVRFFEIEKRPTHVPEMVRTAPACAASIAGCSADWFAEQSTSVAADAGVALSTAASKAKS
jgi:hypothetical protein